MMARKVKAVTTEETSLEKEKQDCLSKIEETIMHLPAPTYRFNVGDEVRYGMLTNCIVEQVIEDGKAYLLLCDATDRNYGKPVTYKTYRLAPWVSTRKLNAAEDTYFTENENIRFNFNNTTVESLLFSYYRFGIDMNPEYQRDFVWNDLDKERLLDSIFQHVDIGKFVLVYRSTDLWKKDNVSFEILDGKQRLSTLLEFYEDRFQYRGKYYSQLSGKDKYTFQEKLLQVAEIKGASREDVLKAFLKLNRGGRIMDQKQIDHVEQMLKEATS